MTNGTGSHKKATKKPAGKPKAKGAKESLKRKGWLPTEAAKEKNG